MEGRVVWAIGKVERGSWIWNLRFLGFGFLIIFSFFGLESISLFVDNVYLFGVFFLLIIFKLIVKRWFRACVENGVYDW